MNFKLRAGALLLGLGFGWFTHAQAADPGWYLLGFGGESSASGLSLNESDENLVAIFNSVGLDVLDLTSTLDDSDVGFGLAGGYQVNDHFALEFAYVDLGSTSYRASATVSDGVTEADAQVELETTADGPVVSMLGILPIGERFSAFGRAGLSFLQAEGTARATIDDVSQRDSQTSQKSDLMFGIGAEFSLNEYFAIRLAWDRYFDVGTQDVSGDIDADHLYLGVRMGLGWFR
jgi:OOP family OmpA-OmpF porin